MSVESFREYLPSSADERVNSIRGLDAYQYREWAKRDPFASSLIEGWKPLYGTPFKGITADGTLRQGLYALEAARAGEEAPTEAMVAAAEHLLAIADERERGLLRYPLDADEWRSWANPEFMQHDTGVRLEFASEAFNGAVASLVDATFSAAGAQLIRRLIRINAFLGEVVDLSTVMNERSYNVALYGVPSLTDPWGWQLFGHHVAVNVVVVGSQMVATPVFFGAEPTVIDAGEDADATVFVDRVSLARQVMHALPPDLRDAAVLYREMVDPGMPPGRIHPGDERHLAGAFQDNRTIPLEGVRVAAMPAEAQTAVRGLIADFVSYLPAGVARRRIREIDDHFEETWFSWIGGFEGTEPFYVRVQSPVIVLELDHHTGVFLTNTEPMGFHVHTVMRTPNGNDYAKALIAQWQREHG